MRAIYSYLDLILEGVLNRYPMNYRDIDDLVAPPEDEPTDNFVLVDEPDDPDGERDELGNVEDPDSDR